MDTVLDYNKHREALDDARMQDRKRQQDWQEQDRNRQQNWQKQDRTRQGWMRNQDKNQQRNSSINGKSRPINPDSKKSALKNLITPSGIFSSLKQINLLKDIPFACALGFAILKDLLDFVLAPTVILSMLGSILCSIFIFMMLILAKASEERKTASRFITKILVIIGGGVVDSLPGIDFLPIETITIIIIYILVLSERAQAEKISQS
jgi:hypothetical protein